ncbi:Siroheme synthase, precorrin 2 oxidase and ferrochelatase domains [Methylobacterium sp. ME121]|nr:Siroheme synthase, precorrin 2 oxidase and ferrochelatase domains [Methylobacterium sp. ME121]
MDNRMNRTTMALAGALSLVLAGPAAAQVVTGGAGNTGVRPPTSTGGAPPGARDLGPRPFTRGNEANSSNPPVPGTTPGVNIGGTPTSGPPGTGGTSGGPSLGR